MKKIERLIRIIAQIIFLCLMVTIAVLPLYSCLVVSLKSDAEMTYNNLISLPENILNLDNYKYVWENTLYPRALLLSVLIVVISTLISVCLSSMVAFVIFRLQPRYRRAIFNVFILASLVPTILVQVYCFQMMAKLQLVNTLVGYILLLCNTDVTALYIFKNNYDSIPSRYDDIATLEGASSLKIFTSIHIPQLRPALITSGLIKAIYVYNEYFLANLYLINKVQYPTVTTVLYSLAGPFGTQYNQLCAGVMLSILPILILFLIFQTKIYNGFGAKKIVRRRK